MQQITPRPKSEPASLIVCVGIRAREALNEYCQMNRIKHYCIPKSQKHQKDRELGAGGLAPEEHRETWYRGDSVGGWAFRTWFSHFPAV